MIPGLKKRVDELVKTGLSRAAAYDRAKKEMVARRIASGEDYFDANRPTGEWV